MELQREPGEQKAKGDFLETSLLVASVMVFPPHANEGTHSVGGGAQGLAREGREESGCFTQ